MPSSVRYQVVGADRLAATIRDLGRSLPADLEPEADAAADALARAASDRAPVRTGALAASIRGEGTPEGIGVASPLRYAPIQEARRHYAAGALAANQSTVVGTLAGGLRRLVARVKGA